MLTGYLSTLPQDVLLNMGVLFFSRNGVATRIGFTEGGPDFDPVVELQAIEFDATGSTSSVTLTWVAVVGATSYRVYRGTASGGQNLYYTAAPTITAYTDTNGSSTVGTPTTSLAVTTITPKAAGTLNAANEYISNL